jgi:hypothetical protein
MDEGSGGEVMFTRCSEGDGISSGIISSCLTMQLAKTRPAGAGVAFCQCIVFIRYGC